MGLNRLNKCHLCTILVFIMAFCFVLNGCSNKVSKDAGTNQVKPAMFDIETPYTTLKYPEKWNDDVRIEENADDGYSLRFFASIGEKEEKEIFVIYFSDVGEFPVGTLKTENGENVHVSFDFSDVSFDDAWSEDEINQVHAMAEDINYLLGELYQNPNFTANK